jgi:hypothetical protein
MQNLDSDTEETEEVISAYKKAAECDEFLFGDYDYSYMWLNDTINNI